eukprot:TRINITY_DN5048_c0_g1_i8.p1 TRINITY_DN5048_c0_g1~~TRINITY_DN5048_c0_g1_i8.p1  ORF type:complete len:576 (-),score=197.65 TRINITY_DN5048_c0_g1_i8:361-2088(-)
MAMLQMQELHKSKCSIPIGDEALTFTSEHDLLAVSEGNAAIANIEQTQYQKLNVEQTFGDLVLCGQLLRSAVTAAGKESCSTPVLAVVTDYQTLCNSSAVASTQFVDACVTSLKYHKLAFKAFSKDKPEAGMKHLEKCGGLAKAMSEAAGGLVEQAQKVTGKAETALLAAQDNVVMRAEEKQQLEKALNEVKAMQAGIDSTLEDLKAQIEEAREDETKFAKQAASERDKELAMTLASGLMQTVGSVALAAIPGCAVSKALTAAAGGALPQTNQGTPKGGYSGVPAAGGSDGSPGAADAAATKAALEAANEEKREIKAQIAKLRVEMKQLQQSDKATSVEGKQRIEEIKEELKILNENNDKMAAAFDKIAGTAAAHAKSLDQKEALATAERRKLQGLLREQNAALKESVAKMDGMKENLSELQQILLVLKTVVQVMGKIVTTFKNVKLFWTCVQGHCMKLKDTNDIMLLIWKEADEDEKESEGFDVIKSQFYESVAGWCALGMISHKANKAIVDAKEFIDEEVMCKLPGGEVAYGKVKEMINDLKSSLAESDKALELDPDGTNPLDLPTPNRGGSE